MFLIFLMKAVGSTAEVPFSIMPSIKIIMEIEPGGDVTPTINGLSIHVAFGSDEQDIRDVSARAPTCGQRGQRRRGLTVSIFSTNL